MIIVFLIALLVMMIKDYRKFYVYLLAIVGIFLQIMLIYPHLFFDKGVPSYLSWICSLIVPIVLFLSICIRRKSDDK